MAFQTHIVQAQTERHFYQEATRRAHAELLNHHPVSGPLYLPCSQPVHAVHGIARLIIPSWSFSPHLCRQPGPLYFKTPRKIQLFGVCSEGIPKQINYLPDEADTIGPNGTVTKSHGANSVVSLQHDFFSRA